MFISKLNGDKTLAVMSNWDSGTHLNFQCNIATENNSYTADTLDKHLTRDQIVSIEAVLLATIKSMLNSKN